jgi:prolyl oligopeptidase
VGSSRSAKPMTYPEARKGEVIDTYHGVQVADPYRWLEDPDSDESRAWIDAQNEITFDFLKSIRQRKRIEKRLTKLWNYEKYGVPFKRGGKYFYTKNDGLQNQSVLYVVEDLDDKPRVLIDPNTFSEDGTVRSAATPSPMTASILRIPNRSAAAIGGPGTCATSSPAKTSTTR